MTKCTGCEADLPTVLVKVEIDGKTGEGRLCQRCRDRVEMLVPVEQKSDKFETYCSFCGAIGTPQRPAVHTKECPSYCNILPKEREL